MAVERQLLEIVTEVGEALRPLTVLENRFKRAAARMEAAIQDVDFDPTSAEARKLQADVVKTGRAFADMADEAEGATTETTREIRKLADSLEETDTTATKATRAFREFGPQIAAAVVAAGAFVAVQLSRELVRIAQASLEVEQRFNGYLSALSTVTDGQEEANQELRTAIEIANQFGLNVDVVTDTYSKFTVAAVKAGLTLQEARQVFIGAAAGARALALSNEDLEGALRALQQVASKGRLSMEELSQQLGERLPGALAIMAEGLGITQAELIKLVETGELTADVLPVLGQGLLEAFGDAAQQQARTLAAEVERVRGEVTLAGNAFAQGFSDDVAEAIRRVAGGVGDLEARARIAGEVLGFLVNVSVTLGEAVGRKLVGDFGAFIQVIGTATSAVLGLLETVARISPGLDEAETFFQRAGEAAKAFAAEGAELAKQNVDVGDTAQKLVDDYQRFQEGLEGAKIEIAQQALAAKEAEVALDALTDTTERAGEAQSEAAENAQKLAAGLKDGKAPAVDLGQALIDLGNDLRRTFFDARQELNQLVADLNQREDSSPGLDAAKASVEELREEQEKLSRQAVVTDEDIARQDQIARELSEAKKLVAEEERNLAEANQSSARQIELHNAVQDAANKLAQDAKRQVEALRKEYEKFGVDGIEPNLQNLDQMIERLQNSADTQSASAGQLELFNAELLAQVDIAQRNIEAEKRRALSIEEATQAAKDAGLQWDENTRTLTSLDEKSDESAQKQGELGEAIAETGQKAAEAKRDLDEVFKGTNEEVEQLVPGLERVLELMNEIVAKANELGRS